MSTLRHLPSCYPGPARLGERVESNLARERWGPESGDHASRIPAKPFTKAEMEVPRGPRAAQVQSSVTTFASALLHYSDLALLPSVLTPGTLEPPADF